MPGTPDHSDPGIHRGIKVAAAVLATALIALAIGLYLNERPVSPGSDAIAEAAPIEPDSVDPEATRTAAVRSAQRGDQSVPPVGWRTPPAGEEMEDIEFPISVAMSRDRKSQEVFLETRIELMTEGSPAMFSDIRRAAEAGDVEAAYRYAMVLMHCHGAPENLSEAEAWVVGLDFFTQCHTGAAKGEIQSW